MAPDPTRAGRAARRGCVLAAALLLVACASDDESGSTTPGSPAPSTTPAATEAVFAPTEETAVAEGSTDQAADASSDATVPIDTDATSEDTGGATDETARPTVPDTGVPGIDSNDAFCRAWSEFGGTFQGLAISWGVGDPADAALNEVAAAGAILRAVDDLGANLPAELEAERADLMALVDPLSQRAAAARDELLAAGVSDDGVIALADAWIATLVEAGTDDPAIVVSIPADVDAGDAEAAAAAFVDERQSLVRDPAMVTDVETPLTEQYLIDNCPDQGTLLGNDDVGGPP